MVAFQEVLDRLNDLFGSEDFSEGQKVSFLEALLRTCCSTTPISCSRRR